MTLRFKIYTRKPQPIQLLEVTEENFAEVCEMLGGSTEDLVGGTIAWGWAEAEGCGETDCDCDECCDSGGYWENFISTGQLLCRTTDPRDPQTYRVYSKMMIGGYECLDEGAIGGLVDATTE